MLSVSIRLAKKSTADMQTKLRISQFEARVHGAGRVSRLAHRKRKREFLIIEMRRAAILSFLLISLTTSPKVFAPGFSTQPALSTALILL